MTSEPEFLWRFYGSFLAASVLCAWAIHLIAEMWRSRSKSTRAATDPVAPAPQRRAEDEDTAQIHIPLHPFPIAIPLPWRFRKIWVLCLSMLSGAGLLVWQALSVDFSAVFPSRMQVQVFYDSVGIENALREYTPAELAAAGIDPAWRGRLADYEEVIRRNLAESWRAIDTVAVRDTALVRRANLHGVGETSFRLERLGFLHYQLTESQGTLEQVILAKNARFPRFHTSFNITESPDDNVESTLNGLMRDRSIILKPHFMQSLKTDQLGEATQVDHVVIAMTKVHISFVPHFNRTVYVWIAPDSRLIPVGYALYYPLR